MKINLSILGVKNAYFIAVQLITKNKLAQKRGNIPKEDE
jgi:hypothetical protein